MPFLLGGVALSMIFDLNRQGAGSLYFADLLGASVGAVSVTLLLQLVGGEVSLLLAAIAPFVASACWRDDSDRGALSRRPSSSCLRVTNGTYGAAFT